MTRLASGWPRQVPVSDGGSRQWVVSRTVASDGSSPRYLFTGPLPGTALFTSSGGPFSNAVADARRQWKDMDLTRREKWFGAKGIYAVEAEKDAK